MEKVSKGYVLDLIKNTNMSDGQKARQLREAGVVIRMDMSKRDCNTLVKMSEEKCKSLRYPYDYRHIDAEDIYAIAKKVGQL